MPDTQPTEDLFDIRKIDRFLAEGKVTPEQYATFLEGLEDCAENAETSHVRMVAYDRSRRFDPNALVLPEEDEG